MNAEVAIINNEKSFYIHNTQSFGTLNTEETKEQVKNAIKYLQENGYDVSVKEEKGHDIVPGLEWTKGFTISFSKKKK